MRDLKIRRFYLRLLNIKCDFLTKTLLFLFIGIILVFVCYVLYGEDITYIYGECQDWFDKSPYEQRLLRDECLLKRFIILPESIEFSLPTRQGTIPRDATWQTVPLEKEKFFVYSAYLDTRMESLGPVIRIIAAAKTYFSRNSWCRLWYSNSSKTVSAFTYRINEHRNFTYSSSFVLCKLPPDESIGNYPISVSVVCDIQDPITNEILIQIPNRTNEFKTDIEVCVQPFHSQYDQGSRIVEFVELYYLLGVKHFTFYNFSVSTNIHCVLDQYKDDDLISVLPWNLDMISDVEIKTEATVAAFNDCLYRYMYTSKFIAIVDIDEMIIPRSHLTLIQLLKKLDSLFIEIPEVHSYSFRNAFFCMELADDELSPDECNQNETDTKIIVLRKTRRKGLILSHPFRTKYICNPRRVIEAGNHVIEEFLDEGTNATVIVPTDMALIHHYRYCDGLPMYCNNYSGNCQESFVIDRSIYIYKNELAKKITNSRMRLNESCVLK